MLGIEIFENSNHLLEQSKRKDAVRGLGLASTPARVIHRDNKLRVLFYERPVGLDAPKVKAAPILIIPSLINRHYILDLMPDKSLVRFLLGQGFDVAMVDWGVPGDEDRYLTLEQHVDSYLHRAIRAVCRETGTEKAVLLGYCLGGTMAAIHAAVRPENVAGLISLTAPINFHNSGLLSAWCRAEKYDVDSLVQAYGNVPWLLMQSSFQWLRPTMNAARQLSLWRRAKDKDFVDSSTALEIWVNDNVAFPGECYKDFIGKFYRENALVKDTLELNGARVDFGRITCPILNVAASDDHIVPLDATEALRTVAKNARDFTNLLTPGGHIGAVISRKAHTHLWPNMSEWLKERFADRQTTANAPASIDTPQVDVRGKRPRNKPTITPKARIPLAEEARPTGTQSTPRRKRHRPWQDPLISN